jgi:hypothetical protein
MASVEHSIGQCEIHVSLIFVRACDYGDLFAFGKPGGPACQPSGGFPEWLGASAQRFGRQYGCDAVGKAFTSLRQRHVVIHHASRVRKPWDRA